MPRQEGVLYVVATPIGNLADITLRALEILRSVDLICAEDTRTTRKLLSRYEIATPMTSFFQHSGREKARGLVRKLEGGAKLALVCEAGTPAIQDPGPSLVSAAAEAGIDVVAVPGPSAVAAALSISGFGGDSFAFLGFLPRSASRQAKLVESLPAHLDVIVLFESPRRVKKTLANLAPILGRSPACIVREATKKFEEVIRGTVADLAASLPDAGLRGEVTIVIRREPRASSS
jgi:16S rRNA (cytidine1402-2'-O)-methyltransferase